MKKLTEGVALNLVGILIKNRFYADNGIDYATQQCLEGFGALDLPQEIAGYKPRPLEGVWATPPFLHNGSVPTLYQMLLPPGTARQEILRRPARIRSACTWASSPSRMPMATTTASGWTPASRAITTPAMPSRPTPRPGRSISRIRKANPLPHGVIGPEFTDEERFDIIEYLKVHRDLPETPADYQPPDCHLEMQH